MTYLTAILSDGSIVMAAQCICYVVVIPSVVGSLISMCMGKG